jgi:hypothetical protein
MAREQGHGRGRKRRGMKDQPSPIITTYSSWQMFLDCQRKYFWRYIMEKVPIGDKPTALFFGTGIHEALRVWHTTQSLPEVHKNLLTSFGTANEALLITADLMMENYAACYPTETFKVCTLEHKFAGFIINPTTARKTRKFELHGKVDGIVLEEADGFILEHKTAANLSKNYLDALWTDFQTLLYSLYIKRTEKIPIKGVIYNILLKPRSDIKDVKKWYEKESRFHREILIFSESDFNRVLRQLWDLTQQLQFAMRRDRWVQDTKQCFVYNHQCPYFQICKSDDNPMVIENYYEDKPAHSELTLDAETNDLL